MITVDINKVLKVLVIMFGGLMLALNMTNTYENKQLEERIERLEQAQIETTIETQRINDKFTKITYIEEDIIAIESDIDYIMAETSRLDRNNRDLEDAIETFYDMYMNNLEDPNDSIEYDLLMAEYAMITVMIESYDTVENPTEEDELMKQWLITYRDAVREELINNAG